MREPIEYKEPLVKLRAFRAADREAVKLLWKRCNLVRPGKDPEQDISRKLCVQPQMFLVGTVDGAIVGTIMAGYEGHRGWINYLAVAPEFQCCGIGRMLMAEAERLLREMGCPKVNLQVRSSNEQVLGFYRQLGFSNDNVISLGKRLLSNE